MTEITISNFRRCDVGFAVRTTCVAVFDCEVMGILMRGCMLVCVRVYRLGRTYQIQPPVLAARHGLVQGITITDRALLGQMATAARKKLEEVVDNATGSI